MLSRISAASAFPSILISSSENAADRDVDLCDYKALCHKLRKHVIDLSGIFVLIHTLIQLQQAPSRNIGAVLKTGHQAAVANDKVGE
nr:hypothetical protein [Paenibacillus cisolokensis]